MAYKSGRGPFGFKPEEMEQALVMLHVSKQAAAKQGEAKPSEVKPSEAKSGDAK